jgi:BirA family transcriptional regulator, biotin operon repressor / biotin---[acetyl-CoA-carboxylase] ligase
LSPSSHPSDQLQSELSQQFKALGLHWQVQVFDSIDSTSTELARQVKNGLRAPKMVLALEQTTGRGRRDKAWVSNSKDSLTVSFGFLLEPQNWLGLSLCVGVDLVQCMDPEQRLGLRLKWPNDVWAQHQGQFHKLAGILMETLTTNANIGARHDTNFDPSTVQLAPSTAARYCVVGIGVNLRAPALHVAPSDAQSLPAVGLMELGYERTATEIVVALANQLPKTLKRFEVEGFTPFQAQFEELNALKGLDLMLSDGTNGLCRGVNAQGELMLFKNGELRALHNLELSVRPIPPSSHLSSG